MDEEREKVAAMPGGSQERLEEQAKLEEKLLKCAKQVGDLQERALELKSNRMDMSLGGSFLGYRDGSISWEHFLAALEKVKAKGSLQDQFKSFEMKCEIHGLTLRKDMKCLIVVLKPFLHNAITVAQQAKEYEQTIQTSLTEKKELNEQWQVRYREMANDIQEHKTIVAMLDELDPERTYRVELTKLNGKTRTFSIVLL